MVFKSQNLKSNSGVYIRMDDGILAWKDKPAFALKRGANGKLLPEMPGKLKGIAEAEEGVWYAVHHGFEVQIMDRPTRRIAPARSTGSRRRQRWTRRSQAAGGATLACRIMIRAMW